MREIKFRAWDEQNKIMHIEVESIRSGTDGNDWILFKSDKQKLEHGNVLDNPYFQQQIKVMPYTGLKDRNGVEIYEGDIVTIMDCRPSLYKICYWDDSFKWGVEYIGNDITNWQCENLENFSGDEFEVIGNIYENPELLKDTK